MNISEEKLYQKAYLLSLFTIFYNLIEGVVSMLLGYEDETLTLFGFGVDSFIEVMSGIGIAMMIRRIESDMGEVQNLVLPPDFVQRKSTAAPA